MKIITIVGARPQFVKAAPVSKALIAAEIEEQIVHTGQHYDEGMSGVFFKEMGIPEPAYNLGIGSASHGVQTGRMMEAMEEVVQRERPEMILIYGDTNSTLAGALVAAKMHIPVAHVEAGLRSFNRTMPEEINRVVADHVSDLLFTPTRLAVNNLEKEGISEGVYHVGDVMYDAALQLGKEVGGRPVRGSGRELEPGRYVLSTLHRAENTDSPARLRSILSALGQLAEDEAVLLPMHPRTKKKIAEFGLEANLKGIDVVEPLGFLDMVAAEKGARVIVTDSGGVQKEAYFHGVPCVTTRSETEWIETVEAGWNAVVDANTGAILKAVSEAGVGRPIEEYGTGDSSVRITEILCSHRQAQVD